MLIKVIRNWMLFIFLIIIIMLFPSFFIILNSWISCSFFSSFLSLSHAYWIYINLQYITRNGVINWQRFIRMSGLQQHLVWSTLRIHGIIYLNKKSNFFLFSFPLFLLNTKSNCNRKKLKLFRENKFFATKIGQKVDSNKKQ